MPETVTMLWLEGTPGEVETVSLHSFVRHGYQVDLFTYERNTGTWNIPEGVTIRDARDILPEPILKYERPQSHHGSPVLHVNLWRYKFLLDHGGCFAELDQLCLKPIPDRHFISSELSGGKPHPNLAILHLPANTDLMRRCWREAQSRLTNPRRGDFGPKLLKQHVEETNYQHIAHPLDFCPLRWSDVDLLLDETYELPDESRGVQLWGGMLRRKGIDLASAPQQSLWKRLCRSLT